MNLIEGNNAFDVYQRCDKGTLKCGFDSYQRYLCLASNLNFDAR